MARKLAMDIKDKMTDQAVPFATQPGNNTAWAEDPYVNHELLEQPLPKGGYAKVIEDIIHVLIHPDPFSNNEFISAASGFLSLSSKTWQENNADYFLQKKKLQPTKENFERVLKDLLDPLSPEEIERLIVSLHSVAKEEENILQYVIKDINSNTSLLPYQFKVAAKQYQAAKMEKDKTQPDNDPEDKKEVQWPASTNQKFWTKYESFIQNDMNRVRDLSTEAASLNAYVEAFGKDPKISSEAIASYHLGLLTDPDLPPEVARLVAPDMHMFISKTRIKAINSALGNSPNKLNGVVKQRESFIRPIFAKLTKNEIDILVSNIDKAKGILDYASTIRDDDSILPRNVEQAIKRFDAERKKPGTGYKDPFSIVAAAKVDAAKADEAEKENQLPASTQVKIDRARKAYRHSLESAPDRVFYIDEKKTNELGLSCIHIIIGIKNDELDYIEEQAKRSFIISTSLESLHQNLMLGAEANNVNISDIDIAGSINSLKKSIKKNFETLTPRELDIFIARLDKLDLIDEIVNEINEQSSALPTAVQKKILNYNLTKERSFLENELNRRLAQQGTDAPTLTQIKIDIARSWFEDKKYEREDSDYQQLPQAMGVILGLQGSDYTHNEKLAINMFLDGASVEALNKNYMMYHKSPATNLEISREKRMMQEALERLTPEELNIFIDQISRSAKISEEIKKHIADGTSLLPAEFQKKIMEYTPAPSASQAPAGRDTNIKDLLAIFTYEGGEITIEVARGLSAFVGLSSRGRLHQSVLQKLQDSSTDSIAPENRLDALKKGAETVFKNMTSNQVRKFLGELEYNGLLNEIKLNIKSGDTSLPQNIQEQIIEFVPDETPADKIFPTQVKSAIRHILDYTGTPEDHDLDKYDKIVKTLFQIISKTNFRITYAEDESESRVNFLLRRGRDYIKEALDTFTKKEIEQIPAQLEKIGKLDIFQNMVLMDDSLLPSSVNKVLLDYKTPRLDQTSFNENLTKKREDFSRDILKLLTNIANNDFGDMSPGQIIGGRIAFYNTLSKTMLKTIVEKQSEEYGLENPPYDYAYQEYREIFRDIFKTISDETLQKFLSEMDKAGFLDGLRQSIKNEDSLLPHHIRREVMKFKPPVLNPVEPQKKPEDIIPADQIAQKANAPKKPDRDPEYVGTFTPEKPAHQSRILWWYIDMTRVILAHPGGAKSDHEERIANVYPQIISKYFLKAQNVYFGYDKDISTLGKVRDEYKKAFRILKGPEIAQLPSQLYQFGILGNIKKLISDNDCTLPKHVQDMIINYIPAPEIITGPVVKTEEETPPVADAEPEDIVIEDIQAPEIVAQEQLLTGLIPSEPTPDYYRVIEVDALILETDDKTDYVTGMGPRERSDEPAPIITQPRQEWLLNGLEADGFKRSDILIYKEKTIEGQNAEKSPYIVIEAMDNDRHLQIALCQIKGNSTYIIRDPIDFEKAGEVTTSELRKREDVYKISCYSENQWMRNIRYYGYKPLDELGEQLKTKLYWADKAQALRNSFGEFYLEHGRFPHTNDTSIIEHGPDYDAETCRHTLKGRTTWARAYQALSLGRIAGLKHVRNYRDLKDEVLGPDHIDPIYPVKKPEPVIFDAKDVYKAVANHVLETGSADLSTIKVDNHGIERLNESFNAKAVIGLEECDLEEIENITSAEDFAEAAGFIIDTGNGAVAAPAQLIRRVLKTLEL